MVLLRRRYILKLLLRCLVVGDEILLRRRFILHLLVYATLLLYEPEPKN